MSGITRNVLIAVTLSLSGLAATTAWKGAGAPAPSTFVVQRGDLAAQLTADGTLRPRSSITYRSPLSGRESEIVVLAPEGSRVSAGDLLVRLDTTRLQGDIDRAREALRQAAVDLALAEADVEDAAAGVQDVAEGSGILAVEEARGDLQAAERRAARLAAEFDTLRPLLSGGFITRDELRKADDARDAASQELQLSRQRSEVVVQMSYPHERQRMSTQLAQKQAQLAHVQTRQRELRQQLAGLEALLAASTITARRPGLVIHEELLSALTRRKIRVGDRVTSVQGLVTIPEVDTMLAALSIGEADVHRVRDGQRAEVRIDAFPRARLAGTVARVGMLAGAGFGGAVEKRFELIVALDRTDIDLRPEMTAHAQIVTGIRSGVLLVPATAVFEGDGSFMVRTAGGARTEARAVTLGASNGELVEVLGGLREGERVVVNAAVPAAPRGGPRTSAPREPGTDALRPY